MSGTQDKRRKLRRERLENAKQQLRDEYLELYKLGYRSELIIKYLAKRYLLAEFTIRDRIGSLRQLQAPVDEAIEVDQIFNSQLA